MNPTTINIELPDGRKSEIVIGSGLLTDASTWQRLELPSKLVVVSNPTVKHLYFENLAAALPTEPDLIEMEDGEAHKSLSSYEKVIDALIEQGHNRTSTILALGGGVVGDLAGFVAATFYRGIRCVQIPTTLLAQVDSSVGGKTAVNHERGKNLIGAFYQPSHAVIDVCTLMSLPDNVFVEGLAEVIKYGVIFDPLFFDWLETNRDTLLARDQDALSYAVAKSCQIKADVVAQDEREQGMRAILNFGHTFGHAIETLAGYGTVLHGEAVAMGMTLAADLSARLALCERADAVRTKELLDSYNLPTHLPSDIRADDMVRIMKLDKKVLTDKIRFVLMNSIGDVVVTDDVASQALHSTLDAGDALCA